MLGVVILLLMMATAFMGYVLPWGQMSYWGATVITNLFSAIPLVGDWIVTLLWGGFAVDNATLNRFFSLHYLLPFVLFGVGGAHVVALFKKCCARLAVGRGPPLILICVAIIFNKIYRHSIKTFYSLFPFW